jgi:hypothetical protein
MTERLVVIIYFEEYRVTVSFEYTEIMLFVRVTSVARIIIDGDCLHDQFHRVRP